MSHPTAGMKFLVNSVVQEMEKQEGEMTPSSLREPFKALMGEHSVTFSEQGGRLQCRWYLFGLIDVTSINIRT